MTVNEFSNQFDTEISAYAKTNELSNILQFDEYEKSVFLTKAQNMFVIGCYTGRNPQGNIFEVHEEDRRLLSSLVYTREIDPIQDINIVPISSSSYFFPLPENILFITYEACRLSSKDDKCIDGKEILVIPVTQDEFHRIKDNPFRGPNNNRVLRLDASKNLVELVSKYDIQKYIVRYLQLPKPIVLIDLSEDLSIENTQNISECRLPEFTHQRILDIAVLLALQSRLNTNNTN